MVLKRTVSPWFVLPLLFFSDICSIFDVFSLLFLLFITSLFLLGWCSVQVPSNLASILINGFFYKIQLAERKFLIEVTVYAGPRDPHRVTGNKVPKS